MVTVKTAFVPLTKSSLTWPVAGGITAVLLETVFVIKTLLLVSLSSYVILYVKKPNDNNVDSTLSLLLLIDPA